MLEKEREYYDENLADWLRLYPGKFVLIKESALIGVFDTVEDAIAAGARRFALESALIRRVQEQQDAVSVPALTLGILRADSTRSV
jgi:hypothetical protein